MQLKLDEGRLINDIIKEINIEMDRVSEILVTLMIQEIDKMPIHNDSFTQWKLDVIDMLHWRAVASAGELVREVGILDQSAPNLYKAFAVAFGTGTLADASNNPWFQEYLSSEYYHTSREGMGIYSLPGEEIYDADTDTWKKSRAINRVALPFLEEKGSEFWTNVFGNSSIMAQTYFNEGIDLAISRIDFSNYLMTTN